jgi:putative ABC transport system substrate-binding protein
MAKVRVGRFLAAAALFSFSVTSGGGADSPIRDGILVVTSPRLGGHERIIEAFAKPSSSAGTLPVRVDVRMPRSGQSNPEFVGGLASELRRYGVVYATSIALARELQRVDARTPIVFKGQADPVTLCLADSMRRPGRNATGYVDYLPDNEEKMLQLLVGGFPSLRTVYVLASGGNYYVSECDPRPKPPPGAPPACIAGLRDAESPDLWWIQETRDVVAEARRLGVEVKFLLLCTVADFERLETLGRGAEGVGFLIPYQGLFNRGADELVRRIERSGRPAIYGLRGFARRGGLMSLEPLLDANDDQVPIDMIRQVLAGRDPSVMPIQTPRGFRFSVNAATADRQSLRPSLSILRRADEIMLGNAP